MLPLIIPLICISFCDEAQDITSPEEPEFKSMKFLAIEKDVGQVDWNGKEDLLRKEAKVVYEFYLSGALREIYFNEHKNAILIMEAQSKRAVRELLDQLPLVQNNLIRFDIMKLRPYTGLSRIIED